MNRRLVCFMAAALALVPLRAAEPVRPLEPSSYRKLVTNHAGRPFVVVLWALDCDYCGPSFKALAQAQQQRTLEVVTIATDRASDVDAVHHIDKKLDAAGLADQRWAFSDAPSERLRYEIDPKWRGEMPRSYWFDGRGGVKAHSGVITPELIRTLAP